MVGPTTDRHSSQIPSSLHRVASIVGGSARGDREREVYKCARGRHPSSSADRCALLSEFGNGPAIKIKEKLQATPPPHTYTQTINLGHAQNLIKVLLTLLSIQLKLSPYFLPLVLVPCTISIRASSSHHGHGRLLVA